MSLPIITPAEGQPLHHLMRELEGLGGVRHQDFRVTSGLERNGYQVSPELYQAWLEHHSGDDPEPDTSQGDSPDAGDTAAADAPEKDAEPEAQAKGADDGKDAEATPAETDAEADAKADAKAEPEAEPEAETKTAAKATTSTTKATTSTAKRSQRG